MNPFLIIQPVITEKTLQQAQKLNAYTFRVDRGASKEQIKSMIEQLYSVEVRSVNTIVGHKSKQATGKRRIKRSMPKVKKAMITLKAGQKIELFDIQGGTEA